MVPLSNRVSLGAGCYWGTEKFVRKDFQKRFPNSVKSATVGFMSPDPNAVKNPSYRAVCSGSTGHVEVLEVELNDPAAHYEELLRFFYMFHDPTTKNRQGNDVGSQYASYIFTYDAEQETIAKRVTRELQDAISRGTLGSCFEGETVRTKLGPANDFYAAEREHQDYLANNPGGYCNHYMRFKEWPAQ
jgi:peptide-methionine (S)-S-oxide reductase